MYEIKSYVWFNSQSFAGGRLLRGSSEEDVADYVYCGRMNAGLSEMENDLLAETDTFDELDVAGFKVIPVRV